MKGDVKRNNSPPDSSITHGILETGSRGTVVAASKHGLRRPVWPEALPEISHPLGA